MKGNFGDRLTEFAVPLDLNAVHVEKKDLSRESLRFFCPTKRTAFAAANQSVGVHGVRGVGAFRAE